jgi:hypothetical protein
MWNMSCIYTGARILVVEYGFIAPADLYAVGGSIIARWNVLGQQWVDTEEQMEQATHKIFCNPSCWFREDLGVIVVPWEQCEGEQHRAPDYGEIASAD